MSNTQATVRAVAHRTDHPGEICRELNRVIAENNVGKFITMFYGVLDTSRKTLRYTNAGHIPPILIRTDDSILRLPEGGVVLGIFRHANYDEGEVEVQSGDRLILFTDGITEASNSLDEEFGMERLIELVKTYRTESNSQVVGAILDAVGKFTAQGFQDDATMMIVSVL
jgi:sigma-B regulation protein RsbU (phosphoserine phosphatase)